MNSRLPPLAALLAAFLILSPPARTVPPPPPAALQGDAAHPEAARWLRSELYFGLGPVAPSDGGAAEARWRAFLDREVTPRFPDGLTVLEAYGQWRGRNETGPSRLRSKVLVILHEDTPASRAAIDAIRVAWKAATGDQSVLLVNEHVEVSF
jgi:hypothetical protein